MLEKMDESILNKEPKNEPLDIKPKIEPKREFKDNDPSDSHVEEGLEGEALITI